MTIFEYAKHYWEKGWQPLPLRPRTKLPAVKWKVYQDRRITLDELKTWFLVNENRNIGIITGAISAVTVCDADSQDAIDRYFLTADPSDLIVESSRGFHFYHKYVPGRNVSVDGIDVRNDGGLITVPPSIHPNGKRYVWNRSGEMTAYDPSWFQKPKSSTACHTFDRSFKTPDVEMAVERCRRYLAKMEPAIAGQHGHRQMFKAACRVRDFLREHMDWEQALPVLCEFNERAEPPFSVPELQHKLEDAWRK